MNKLKSKGFVMLIIGLIFSISVCAQNSKKELEKNRYDKIEVVKFDLEAGVEKFTESSLDVMMSEIVDQLKKLGKFNEVRLEQSKTKAPTVSSELAIGEPISETTNVEANEPMSETTLRLTGTVTEFKPGSRAARYLIGLGAGRAKVKAHIKILNSNGVLLFEKDVDGNVVMGVFGGDGGGVTRGLAKEVAKVTSKRFF